MKIVMLLLVLVLLVSCTPAETTVEVEGFKEISCPRGIENDPYPGRCYLYTDSDGNGICDLSE